MIDIGVTGLVKSFDLEKKILDGLTLQIDTGERVGILGRNGSGKSTLIRLIGGADRPSSGSIVRGMRVSWPLALISLVPVLRPMPILKAAWGSPSLR